jgi:hypothetical protein
VTSRSAESTRISPAASPESVAATRPLTRVRAEALLASVLDRAAAYDADDTKPFRIKQLVVFGSYLDPAVSHLGDLDLAVETEDRGVWPRDPEALLA